MPAELLLLILIVLYIGILYIVVDTVAFAHIFKWSSLVLFITPIFLFYLITTEYIAVSISNQELIIKSLIAIPLGIYIFRTGNQWLKHNIDWRYKLISSVGLLIGPIFALIFCIISIYKFLIP